jgi:hypothetical protein
MEAINDQNIKTMIEKDEFTAVGIEETSAIFEQKNQKLLLIMGGHGGYQSLFKKEWNKDFIREQSIVKSLKHQGVTFQAIMPDICVSAYSMSYFGDLLTPNGILIGNLTSTSVQIAGLLLERESKAKGQGFSQALKKKLVSDITLQEILDYSLSGDPKICDFHYLKKAMEEHLVAGMASNEEKEHVLEYLDNCDRRQSFINMMSSFKHTLTIDSAPKVLKEFKKHIELFAKQFPNIVEPSAVQSILSRLSKRLKSTSALYRQEEVQKLRYGMLSEFDFLKTAEKIKEISNATGSIDSFFARNPFSAMLVYSNKDRKYYYPKWIDGPLGNCVSMYSDSDSADLIRNDFLKIKKLYLQDGVAKENQFVAVSDFPLLIERVIGIASETNSSSSLPDHK